MIALETPPDREAAAGEYVLGSLSEPDRIAFEHALANDRALQAEVYAWQDRLLGLSSRAVPAEPSPGVWMRLDAAVSASTPRAGSSPKAAARRPRWWQQLAPWQGLSGLAVAAALVMAVMLAGGDARIGLPEPRYLALLQSPVDQSTGWVVEMAGSRSVRLVPVAERASVVTVPEGKSLQFWTKPQGAAGPTSLGLVQPAKPVSVPLPPLAGAGEQQLFEITLEPAGGSPIGRPTGPILYVGRTVPL